VEDNLDASHRGFADCDVAQVPLQEFDSPSDRVYVFSKASRQIIDDADAVSLRYQPLRDVRSDEACTAGNESGQILFWHVFPKLLEIESARLCATAVPFVPGNAAAETAACKTPFGPFTPASPHFVLRIRVRETQPPVSCAETREAPSLTFGPALARGQWTKRLLDPPVAIPLHTPQRCRRN
jgi:hypothetical protein